MKEFKTTTEYKGVYFHQARQRYHGSFFYKGIKYSCGHWKTAKEAAIARDKRMMEAGVPERKLQILKKIEA